MSSSWWTIYSKYVHIQRHSHLAFIKCGIFRKYQSQKRNRLLDQAGNFWEIEKIFKVGNNVFSWPVTYWRSRILTIVGKDNYLLFTKVKKLLADIAPLKATRGDGMYIVSPVNTFTPGWDTFLSFFQ
jgi:hypothetical protein